MTKKTVEILNFQRWIERKGWKEKEREKKEQALKQRSVHFQTSLTRFHVFHREINPDEAGNSAPTQRQRTATFNVKIFHGGRIFSFLLCGPKARFGSMTSNLFPSVRPFDPSLPLPVFSAVQSVFSSSGSFRKPCLIIEPCDGLRNPFLSLSLVSFHHPSRYWSRKEFNHENHSG